MRYRWVTEKQVLSEKYTLSKIILPVVLDAPTSNSLTLFWLSIIIKHAVEYVNINCTFCTKKD